MIVDPPFNQLYDLEKYPKILHYSQEYAGLQCIAFEKLDGSNLAWKWSEGFVLEPSVRSGKTFQEHDRLFGKSIDLFKEKFEKKLHDYLFKNYIAQATVFTEYFGDKSFAGHHHENDIKHLKLIDIWISGTGFLGPNDFITLIDELDIESPKIVYKGKLTGKFCQDLMDGKYKVNEGIVAKGGKTSSIWCCKLKTKDWLEREKALNERG